MKVIDVHCHIVPADFPARPQSCTSDKWPGMNHRDKGQAMVMSGTREFRLVDSRCWDAARRLADMNEEDVGIQIVSPMPELLGYWIEPKDALVLAHHINGVIADMIAGAPERFGGLGMVPLHDPELAARELAALKTQGIRGVEIGSNIVGRSPGDPFFDVFYAEAERLDLAVFVHALHPIGTDRLVGPRQVEPYVCHPTDVGFAAASFITARTLQKFPKLRLGFSHGGGTLGAFLPRLESGWTKLAPLKQAFDSPLATARRFYYDNLTFDPRTLRYVIDLFGPTQVFVGSDYPFTAGQKNSAQTFDGLGLSAEELAAVRGGNAERYLGL